jgi:hypothetical protein
VATYSSYFQAYKGNASEKPHKGQISTKMFEAILKGDKKLHLFCT